MPTARGCQRAPLKGSFVTSPGDSGRAFGSRLLLRPPLLEPLLLLDLLRDRLLLLLLSLLLEQLLLELPLPALRWSLSAAFSDCGIAAAAVLAGAAVGAHACGLTPDAVTTLVLTRKPGSRAALAAGAFEALLSPSRAAFFGCGRTTAGAAAGLVAAASTGGDRVAVARLATAAVATSAFCGDAEDVGGDPGPDPGRPVWRAFQRCARSACRAFSSASLCTAAGARSCSLRRCCAGVLSCH